MQNFQAVCQTFQAAKLVGPKSLVSGVKEAMVKSLVLERLNSFLSKTLGKWNRGEEQRGLLYSRAVGTLLKLPSDPLAQIPFQRLPFPVILAPFLCDPGSCPVILASSLCDSGSHVL